MTDVKTLVISKRHVDHPDVWELTSNLLPVCGLANLCSVFVAEIPSQILGEQWTHELTSGLRMNWILPSLVRYLRIFYR